MVSEKKIYFVSKQVGQLTPNAEGFQFKSYLHFFFKFQINKVMIHDPWKLDRADRYPLRSHCFDMISIWFGRLPFEPFTIGDQ